MHIHHTRVLLLAACALAGAACGNRSITGAADRVGSLSAALSLVSAHDVVSVRYSVMASADTCAAGTPLDTRVVALEDEALPPGVQPPGGGDGHRFADALFTFPPGAYRICATPLDTNGEPSDECASAEAAANVLPEATSEVLLVSQCIGDPSGAIDAITLLNDPPRIDGIAVSPSKFIVTCETATISITASDLNGDDLTYEWSVVSGPAGASLVPAGASATFMSPSPGDYTVRVTVTDVYGGTTALTFPVHVSVACDDAGICDAGPTCGPGFVGCSDGQREGFLDTMTYPNIAACSGGWRIPGIHTLNPGIAPACGVPTSNTQDPACGRTAGDDSTNPTGIDCNVQDLCAAGWHVCTSAEDVTAHSTTGCAGAATGDAPLLFFATRQSSNGCGVCATGTRTDPDCNSLSCTPGCAQTASISNDVFGCGNFGSTAILDCGPLQRFSSDECSALVGSPWSCDSPAGVCETYTVTKPGPDFGGVLCCRD